jgi:hypothetical protein
VSEPALLERERELCVIDGKLDEAVAGRGSLVVIEGPAGIGKSALVERSRAAALERNVAVAHARGSKLERADAFGVARQLFEARLRGMPAAARERSLGGAAALAAPVVLPGSAPVRLLLVGERPVHFPGGADDGASGEEQLGAEVTLPRVIHDKAARLVEQGALGEDLRETGDAEGVLPAVGRGRGNAARACASAASPSPRRSAIHARQSDADAKPPSDPRQVG